MLGGKDIGEAENLVGAIDDRPVLPLKPKRGGQKRGEKKRDADTKWSKVGLNGGKKTLV